MKQLNEEPAAGDPETRQLARSHLNFPIVGIGASAGGLTALQRMLEATPDQCSMAFVIVMHLSPEQESGIAGVLQRNTRMPVLQVTKPVSIEQDHVYVIPPGHDLMLTDGMLRLEPLSRQRGPHTAIDVFFRTLAYVHQERAIAVVLSGMGADGAVGLMRVKEEGGITVAQSPADAEYDSMPRAAIATGMVDIALPAAEIPQRLSELWHNARMIWLPRSDDPHPPKVHPPADRHAEEAAELALQDIMATLRARTGHDFRHYKRATVLRRIERRLQVCTLPDLPSYSEHLKTQPDETAQLLQDLLISVTNFFRDREAFESLEREVISAIFQRAAQGEQIRAWSVGCATGEEAFSVGMLLRERADTLSQPPDIQVFASDIDERAIGVARSAMYSEAIVTDIAPTRLRQHFLREQGLYRVSPAIRERTLFAVHNILHDPPFSRLDLICCRNLLIYLDRKAQESALELFRFSLKPGGYLFLGNSESTDAAPAGFIVADKKNRIYQVASYGTPPRYVSTIGSHGVVRADSHRQARAELLRERAAPTAAELHRRALERVSPPSVLLDAQHNVLHQTDGMARYLEQAGGTPTHNLVANVRHDLRLDLRTALFKAQQSDEAVASSAETERDGRKIQVRMQAIPQRAADAATRTDLMLVVFDETELGEPETERGQPAAARHELQQRLEEEIRQLKQHLQETLEHSQTSHEELKASNEELQAINEELRSATEELETSKEELQSMNEELITVNLELKTKVDERGKIADDLQNLIVSSDIATVFVDVAMRIKRFTPQASKLFNLIATDVGRPLLDITHRLDYDDMAEDADSAFRQLRVVERRVDSRDRNQHYFARILPYRTGEDRIEGAVLTFFDITQLQRAETRARYQEEQLALVAATTQDYAILTLDDDGLVTTWNTGAERIFGWSQAEAIGRHVSIIFTPEDCEAQAPQAEMSWARECGRAEDERWHRRKDGSVFFCSGVMNRLDTAPFKGFAKIARDMTGRRQQTLAQDQLLQEERAQRASAQDANERKDEFLAVMSHELKQPLNLVNINVELLMRTPDARNLESVQRAGAIIKRAVASQAKIIDDLLELSRVRTGKLKLNRQRVLVNEIVESLLAAASVDMLKKHITLEAQLEGEGLYCDCDPVRAEQIIWNLLSNAIKFTPQGGSIRVELHTAHNGVCLRVTDSGRGIAAEFLPQVFGMFSQERESARESGGLGIGLALVQELVLAHGGWVRAESDGLGRGACFTVWLPLLPCGEGARTDADEPISLANLRILAVDDYRDTLEPLAQVLRLEGATVDTALSVDEALAALESADYDLLLSDIGMPGRDGFELIAAVRSNPRLRHMRAIALTGFGREGDVQKSRSAGFDAHLSKPASVELIEQTIARLGNR